MLAVSEADDAATAVGIRLAALALVSLAVALVLGWGRLLPVSLVLLGAVYVTHLGFDEPSLDARAPLVGVGLLLTAELAFWSLEERQRVHPEPGERLRRLGFLAVLSLAGLVVGAGLLGLADAARTQGLAIDLLGAAAAAAALLVVVLAARRQA